MHITLGQMLCAAIEQELGLVGVNQPANKVAEGRP